MLGTAHPPISCTVSEIVRHRHTRHASLCRRTRAAHSEATMIRSLPRRVLALAACLALAPSAAFGQAEPVALPTTPAGHLADGWMQQCRSHDVGAMTQWESANLSDDAAKRFPAELRARTDAEACTANSGFRVASITKSEPNAITLVMLGLTSGTWFEMSLVTTTAGKLDRLGTRPTLPPEAALPKDLSDAALASDVKQQVATLAQRGLFSGIVTVARGTQIIATASANYADRAKHTPITDSTRFTLGSMGKMFTAASIGQLVDQGKVSFADTVGKFFPDYPNETIRRKATVGMLLSHTAGLGDFLSKRTPEMMKNGVKRAAEFMPLYDADAPLFPPGSGWSYSNAGLALAGAIVEQVSGEDYPDYIRKHIFAVAGMHASDPNNVPYAGPLLVTPYTKFTPQGPATDWQEAEHDIGSPAGGAISTAGDLVRFAVALRDGKLVSQRTFAEMVKPHGTVPTGDKYGYAMEISDTYGRTIVGHGGGFPGVSTHLYLVLGSPYTVVILANQDPPADAYAGSMVVAIVAEKAKLGK
jgi:D-alanyl-D-alanine carboxypeptidase